MIRSVPLDKNTPPVHAAIGRGFMAGARPKGYDGKSKRHEPRPTQTQPGMRGSAQTLTSSNLHIVSVMRSPVAPALRLRITRHYVTFGLSFLNSVAKSSLHEGALMLWYFSITYQHKKIREFRSQ